MLRTILQSWLGNTLQSRLRDTVLDAARDQANSPAPPLAEEPKPCHLGFVFALGIESGCLEDQLQGMITIRADGFLLREGGLKGRRAVIILAGAGQPSARRATELLIDGHRPQRIISAGFAGALSPELQRNDILLANQLLAADGTILDAEPWLPSSETANSRAAAGLHHGCLLTLDSVVRLPAERETHFRRHGAVAVDMESFAIAEVCRRRGVPFSSVRVINDTADEQIPPDIERLLSQQSGSAMLGAALGAIWRRPASAKEMYQLRENALVASKRLANFLVEWID